MNRNEINQYLLKFYQQYSDMDETLLKDIVENTPTETFNKGDILLHQGDKSEHCMFVVKGCIRQYRVDENGNEITSEFYTEKHWINVFNESINDNISKYSLSCLEDVILVYSDFTTKNDMFDKYAELKDMTTTMLEEKIGIINESIFEYAAMSPKERVESLMSKRPDLFERVAQHQLASYLGITPESLSRIKKRINRK